MFETPLRKRCAKQAQAPNFSKLSWQLLPAGNFFSKICLRDCLCNEFRAVCIAIGAFFVAIMR
jgi:hypothetical protein